MTAPVFAIVTGGEMRVFCADGSQYRREYRPDGTEHWVELDPLPRTQRAAQLPIKAAPVAVEAA